MSEFVVSKQVRGKVNFAKPLLAAVALSLPGRVDASSFLGGAELLFPLPPQVTVSDVTATEAGGNAQVFNSPISHYTSAAVWDAPTGAAAYLNPSSTLPIIATSMVNATDGVNQVGVGSGPSLGGHALLWSGTADSAIDLNPTKLPNFGGYSQAWGLAGNQQVGEGDAGGVVHALLWNGSASSAVDLQAGSTLSSKFYSTSARGTDGHFQVGFDSLLQNELIDNAIMWHGTAASMVNLNPAGVGISEALGVGGGSQVGVAYIGEPGTSQIFPHAFAWSGTAASAVDLNPVGFVTSTANATNGPEQVGWASPDGSSPPTSTTAYAWYGTAASGVNLSLLLPAGGNWQNSEAYSVDAAGNVFGDATEVFGDTQTTFAVEWPATAVPEPSLTGIFVVCGATLLRRGHRKMTKKGINGT